MSKKNAIERLRLTDEGRGVTGRLVPKDGKVAVEC